MENVAAAIGFGAAAAALAEPGRLAAEQTARPAADRPAGRGGHWRSTGVTAARRPDRPAPPHRLPRGRGRRGRAGAARPRPGRDRRPLGLVVLVGVARALAGARGHGSRRRAVAAALGRLVDHRRRRRRVRRGLPRGRGRAPGPAQLIEHRRRARRSRLGSLPSVRAVVCTELGPLDTLVVEEREPPAPGEGQVVVDVRAAGVNFVDGLICQGRYQIKPPDPLRAGERDRRRGRRRRHRGERHRGRATGSSPSPGSAASPSRWRCRRSRWSPMPDADRLRPGRHAHPELLHRAVHADPAAPSVARASGCSSSGRAVASDWPRSTSRGALGGRVIAAASTHGQARGGAWRMGAEATIAYEDEDLKTRARELSGGGVDVVIDPVGGRHSESRPAGHPAPGAVLRDRFRIGIDRLGPAQPGPAQQPDRGGRRLGRVGRSRTRSATGSSSAS